MNKYLLIPGYKSPAEKLADVEQQKLDLYRHELDLYKQELDRAAHDAKMATVRSWIAIGISVAALIIEIVTKFLI